MDDVVQVIEKSNSVQEKLKELYKKQLTIPRAAWMESGMDLPLQEFYVQLNLELIGQTIAQNQIFDDVTAKRILIEGLPGYGKTTFVTKIAYDWAVNEEYTQRFQLVFLLAVRGLEEVSVVDGIVDLVADSEYENPEEIREMIKREEDKILLIFDGFDEATRCVRDKILKILYKKEMKRMTVIVTCRSNEFSLEPDESRALLRGLSIKSIFYDQRVTVLGIRKEQKTEFLKKFLRETESVENVIEHLKNTTETAQDFFHSPLMLILLADMVVRGEPIGPVTSKTRFYKDVVNFKIMKSEERRNIFLSPQFDVFAMKNSENGKYKIQLGQFGLLCFQRVWGGNQLEFDDNKLTQNMHKLELLIIQKKMSHTRCKNYYQIHHRTFLEFMTAYYIFEDFLRNNSHFSKDIERMLVKDVIDFGKSSMVTPFLIGLMRDKARHYFNLMSDKYVDLFQYNQIALWRMLMECECIEQVENSLIPNLPMDMHELPLSKDLVPFYSSDLHKDLVKLGTESGRIMRITLESSYKFSLPMDNIELPNVSICISNKTIDDLILPQILPQISCKRCHLVLSTTCDENQFIHSFKILTSIPSKLYTFESLNENAINLRHVKDDLGKNILIDRLIYNAQTMNRFDPDHESVVFEATCKALDTFKINLFSLNGKDGTDVIKFLPHCTKVDHLRLNFIQMSSISMDAIFLDKRWKSVHLDLNVKLTLPATKEFYVCERVMFFGISENRVLSKISGISRLECWATTLDQLMQNPLWPCWHTLTEIILLNNLYAIEFWKDFKLFPNLQLLQIEKWAYSYFKSIGYDILPYILQLSIPKLIVGFREHFDDELSFVDNLSNSLQNLAITSLKILVTTIDDTCPITNYLVRKCADILKICSEKNLSLKTIELNLPMKAEEIFDIERHCNSLDVKFTFHGMNLVFVSMSSR